MNFDFSDDQYLFRESFQSYLRDQFPLDVFIQEINDKTIGSNLWGALADLGLFGILAPEELGGIGLSFIDLALILEELGAALVPAPVVETLAVQDLILRHGSVAQKESLVTRIVAGDLSATIALQETGVDYGPATCETGIVQINGEMRLSGQKMLVMKASSVDYVLVLARLDASESVVPVLIPSDRDGLHMRSHHSLDIAVDCCELTMTDVLIESADIIGPSNNSRASERLFDVCAFMAAAQATGVARKVLEISVSYASQRMQFDKPIGSFQTIKHRCADMAVDVDAAQSATYYAAWAVAQDSEDRPRAVSIAKSFCAEIAQAACHEATQIHGGMGFTWELGLHYYLRRAALMNSQFGDIAFHRERVMAGSLAQLGL